MTSSSNVENLSPQVIRQVSKELSQLIANPPEGIRVIPNDDDVSDIQAIIDGPACTPYHGGAFRVKLILGKDFPSAPPKGYFITKIFHPNVSRNGEICVNTLKKDWKSNLGIKHILLTVKCLLIVPNAESALNEEAGKLLLEHYDDYCRRARMMTEIHARPSKQPKAAKEEGFERKEEPLACCSNSNSHNSNQSMPNGNANGAHDVDVNGIGGEVNGPVMKKHAGENSKSASNKNGNNYKSKDAKDKKRTLKRL